MKKPLPGLKLTPAAPDQPVARLVYSAKLPLTGSKSQTFVVLFGAFGRMLSHVFAGFAPSEKFNGLPTTTKALGRDGIVTLTYTAALTEQTWCREQTMPAALSTALSRRGTVP